MRGRIESFELRTGSSVRIIEAAVRHGGDEPGVHLLLLAGTLAGEGRSIAAALSREAPRATWLLVPCSGVLSEAGEIESEPAAVGLTLPGVHTEALLAPNSDHEFGLQLGVRLVEKPGSSALVFLRGDLNEDGWLGALEAEAASEQAQVFGGGTLPKVDLWVSGTGTARPGAAAALIVERPLLGRLTTSAGCQLISPLHSVTKVRERLLLELDDMPALDLLGVSAEGQDERELILLAVGSEMEALSPDGRNVALRAIVGVDPDQQGILIGEELPLGTPVGFAVRDAHGARQDLEAHLAALRRSCCGAAPAFGLYVSCAGRGRALYGSGDVDVRLIKRYFPDMPLAGFHSTFEVAPLGGKLTPQVYGGALGVFCAPS